MSQLKNGENLMALKIIEGPKVPDHLGGHMNKTHVDEGALQFMYDFYDCRSLIDVGCGPGRQIEAAKYIGYTDVRGVDGDWSVLPKTTEYILHDFTESAYRPFVTRDLAWCVEFLEHVEEKYMENYMPIFSAARYALITFAPPGHGGHHHVNEQNLDYWVDKFSKYDMIYNQSLTERVRAASTMAKPFMQTRGVAFVNQRNI
jgi:SAM-dependent methyltransferase